MVREFYRKLALLLHNHAKDLIESRQGHHEHYFKANSKELLIESFKESSDLKNIPLFLDFPLGIAKAICITNTARNWNEDIQFIKHSFQTNEVRVQ